ncbi:hypothetical protein OK074_4420, partial [Actinobacteria bacterium OK074]
MAAPTQKPTAGEPQQAAPQKTTASPTPQGRGERREQPPTEPAQAAAGTGAHAPQNNLRRRPLRLRQQPRHIPRHHRQRSPHSPQHLPLSRRIAPIRQRDPSPLQQNPLPSQQGKMRRQRIKRLMQLYGQPSPTGPPTDPPRVRRQSLHQSSQLLLRTVVEPSGPHSRSRRPQGGPSPNPAGSEHRKRHRVHRIPKHRRKPNRSRPIKHISPVMIPTGSTLDHRPTPPPGQHRHPEHRNPTPPGQPLVIAVTPTPRTEELPIPHSGPSSPNPNNPPQHSPRTPRT